MVAYGSPSRIFCWHIPYGLSLRYNKLVISLLDMH
jgi:hypothetical protein